MTFKTIYVPPFSAVVVFMYRTSKPMYNLFSYCGLADARKRASNKDLPVKWVTDHQKVGLLLENKGFQKLKVCIKNSFNKECAHKLLLIIEKENCWHRKTDSVIFWQAVTSWIFGKISWFLGPRKLVVQKVNIRYLRSVQTTSPVSVISYREHSELQQQHTMVKISSKSPNQTFI